METMLNFWCNVKKKNFYEDLPSSKTPDNLWALPLKVQSLIEFEHAITIAV